MSEMLRYAEEVEHFREDTDAWAESLLGTVEQLAGQLYLLRRSLQSAASPEEELLQTREVAKDVEVAGVLFQPMGRAYRDYELPERPTGAGQT